MKTLHKTTEETKILAIKEAILKGLDCLSIAESNGVSIEYVASIKQQLTTDKYVCREMKAGF